MSQHAGAWSSEAFQRSFRAEPRPFCQRCHAPEEDPSAAPGQVGPEAAALGVGCVTCHVEPGTTEIWAAPRPDATTVDTHAPHLVRRGLAFAGPQACAGCHEFPFPDDALRDHPLAMQSTISEHGRSPAAHRSCADCHMPTRSQGHRDHAFPGAYDRDMLARSIVVEATRPSPTEVSLRLAAAEVGHAVPTGDLLRRIEVEVLVEGDGPDDAPAFRARRHFARRFGPVQQAQGITLRGELDDHRVGVGPDGGVQEAWFSIPASLAARSVRWQVTHQRVALASFDPRRATLDGELPMASGVLRPP